jgi:hypothetical protein
MKKVIWLTRGLVLCVFFVLLAIPIDSNAGLPVGGTLVISAEPEQEVMPAVAYNSQRHQYLVVWYNDRPGCDDIRAKRLRQDGAPVGGPFYISAGCPADRRNPDVAYDSLHDQYLVVWEQEEASSGFSIQARRVSGDGQVLDAADIPIRSAGANLYTPVQPAVEYAFTSDRYLVIWAETWHPMPIQYEISGQVVTDAGGLEGNRFPINQNTQQLAAPDLAYNRHANRYLVVWQLDAGALWDVHGQQVHGGGGLFQGDITIAYFTKSSTAPAVAALPNSPNDDKFLVVWETLYAPNDRDIYGRLVAEDGGVSADFWISWTNGSDESSPAIASGENGLQYFVTWRQPQGVVDNPIKGRAVSFEGTLLGPVVDFSGVAADSPGMASGLSGDILITFQDQPAFATNTHIFGRLWGNRTYLPLAVGNSP